jgi:hypothetical protein
VLSTWFGLVFVETEKLRCEQRLQLRIRRERCNVAVRTFDQDARRETRDRPFLERKTSIWTRGES